MTARTNHKRALLKPLAMAGVVALLALAAVAKGAIRGPAIGGPPEGVRYGLG